MALISPDGNSVVFNVPAWAQATFGGQGLFRLSIDRHGTPARLGAGRLWWPTDWGSDGRTILIQHNDGTNFDISGLDVETGTLTPVLHTPATEGQGRLSPDQRWLAHISDESGQFEVYVRPFRRPGESTLVSESGGNQPRWRRDGRELFYLTREGDLMAVDVDTDVSHVRLGPRRRLFRARVPNESTVFASDYAPTANGTAFVMNVLTSDVGPESLTALLNFTAALKK
jgi:hypothetical protein